METTEKKSGQSGKAILIVAVVVALVVIIAAVVIVTQVMNRKDDSNSVIGYSTEAQMLVTQEDIDRAAEEALKNAENGDVGLCYQNDAFSSDGLNFECYIMNSTSNKFDMFLTIYTDLALTDEIFRSQLVPVGSGFQNITLEKALDEGDHTVYVVLTQIKNDEETGEEEVANQVIHTMDFHVGSDY